LWSGGDHQEKVFEDWEDLKGGGRDPRWGGAMTWEKRKPGGSWREGEIREESRPTLNPYRRGENNLLSLSGETWNRKTI